MWKFSTKAESYILDNDSIIAVTTNPVDGKEQLASLQNIYKTLSENFVAYTGPSGAPTVEAEFFYMMGQMIISKQEFTDEEESSDGLECPKIY